MLIIFKDMKTETTVLLKLPPDINYELNVELAGLKRDGFPKTKHNLILDLLRTALNLEENENI